VSVAGGEDQGETDEACQRRRFADVLEGLGLAGDRHPVQYGGDGRSAEERPGGAGQPRLERVFELGLAAAFFLVARFLVAGTLPPRATIRRSAWPSTVVRWAPEFSRRHTHRRSSTSSAASSGRISAAMRSS